MHGNRIVAALVFSSLPTAKFKDPSFEFETAASSTAITQLVDEKLEKLVEKFETHYSNSIIPTLFKNQHKCDHLVKVIHSEV